MKDKNFSTRRRFLSQTSILGVGAIVSPGAIKAANKANNGLQVGVIGLGRGIAHVRRFAETPEVEVSYVCDVDESRLSRGAKAMTKGRAKGVSDFRRILDDKQVDVVSIAAPNFWHAPASILAMQAGNTCTSRSREATTWPRPI